MTNDLRTSIEQEHLIIQKRNAQKIFSDLIQKSQYVGELFSINYETEKVQIHDSERKKVGGIPSLSFLIATRLDSKEKLQKFFNVQDITEDIKEVIRKKLLGK